MPKPMLRKKRREAAILWTMVALFFVGSNLFALRVGAAIGEVCGHFMGAHESLTRGTR